MSESNDRLYQSDTVPRDFAFNEHVVEVFDDMLNRSIPCYHQVIKATADLLDRYLEPGDRVCDLGCSTGTPLLEISRLLAKKKLNLVGIDNSPAMLEKARLKAELYSKGTEISFEQQDITALNGPESGAFILNYTLQFIRPILRKALVKKLFDNLKPGGLLIMSEKTINHDQKLNRVFIDMYHRFKRERGYSELEIARKREALENILIPFSTEENSEMLIDAGFETVSPFFQWFNFTSVIAIKQVHQRDKQPSSLP
ncbi:MAG: carboxy-S-adenosyl-L-methionine synthase CmoA [Proteobacteria bacterium]|nr:MAG: carboxy-S-adenosyl-L-methionine synthase CmoA [Pseudomonadota bacterium]PIE64445.1 MAG: carboxy-S-adenosyl-L-methionine synthase CmoA [Desulfobacterales bacterium]